MAAYDSLKGLVQQAIRTNGNNEITGQVLQNVLMAMIDELGGENGYAGVATPSTNPGAPDGKVFYFATEAGTYTHFDGATLAKGIHLLVFNGVTWSHQTLYTIDSEVTSGSNNLITSGAVYTKIINAINALDATVSKSAGADGLSLSLTETDGKVTSISGSIAPQTYDAYGAASAAQIAASTDATNKVNAAKTQILGDAASDYNTLGKLEDKIQAEASRAAAAESALNTAKADKATTLAGYGINDAYTKTEVNGLVSTPHQNYVTVPTYASLPATGSADTIYRVSNYNGSTSQVDASVYSEYAWNGSGYTFLRVVSQIGEVFDITVYNSNTKYADLAAALGTNGANVPSSIRRGGMSVKFVQSSDNMYLQFRCMADEFTTDVTKWQGVDVEPTDGSKNLVESGGVAGYQHVFDQKTTIKGGTYYPYVFAEGKKYLLKNTGSGSYSVYGSVTGEAGSGVLIKGLSVGETYNYVPQTTYNYVYISSPSTNILEITEIGRVSLVEENFQNLKNSIDNGLPDVLKKDKLSTSSNIALGDRERIRIANQYNLFHQADALLGKAVSASDGTINDSSTGFCSALIPVVIDKDNIYEVHSWQNKLYCYDSQENFISVITVNSINHLIASVVLPQGTAYVRLNNTLENFDNTVLELVQGGNNITDLSGRPRIGDYGAARKNETALLLEKLMMVNNIIDPTIYKIGVGCVVVDGKLWRINQDYRVHIAIPLKQEWDKLVVTSNEDYDTICIFAYDYILPSSNNEAGTFIGERLSINAGTSETLTIPVDAKYLIINISNNEGASTDHTPASIVPHIGTERVSIYQQSNYYQHFSIQEGVTYDITNIGDGNISVYYSITGEAGSGVFVAGIGVGESYKWTASVDANYIYFSKGVANAIQITRDSGLVPVTETVINIASYNVGDFSGQGLTTPSDNGKLVYHKAISAINANILLSQEDVKFYGGLDTGMTEGENVRTAIYGMYKYFSRMGSKIYNFKSFASDYSVNNVRAIDYVVPSGKSYTFAHKFFLAGEILIDGKIILLVNVHFDWEDIERRWEQINQVIAYAESYDMVVVAGDTNPSNRINGKRSTDDGANVQDWIDLGIDPTPIEIHSVDWAMFADAGYSMANGGYWGDWGTLADGSGGVISWYPFDNIFIKGGTIRKMWVHEESYMNDHRPIGATIVF